MIGLHKKNQQQGQTQKAEPVKNNTQHAAIDIKATTHDIPKLASTVIELSKELIDILVKEKELVAKKDVEKHRELLKVKQRFAAEYNRHIEILYSNKESLQALPEEMKKTLRDTVKNVEAVAAENARMLKASCDASRQFVSNVMAAVKAEKLSPPSYKDLSKTQKDKYDCQPVSICKTV